MWLYGTHAAQALFPIAIGVYSAKAISTTPTLLVLTLLMCIPLPARISGHGYMDIIDPNVRKMSVCKPLYANETMRMFMMLSARTFYNKAWFICAYYSVFTHVYIVLHDYSTSHDHKASPIWTIICYIYNTDHWPFAITKHVQGYVMGFASRGVCTCVQNPFRILEIHMLGFNRQPSVHVIPCNLHCRISAFPYFNPCYPYLVLYTKCSCSHQNINSALLQGVV